MPREDVPADLRRDVRLLSTLLGEVIVESDGRELLDDIERLRRATIALRARPGAARTRAVTDIVSSFDARRAEQVARAFTCYFQLVNLAEEHHRVRTLRERANTREVVDDSLVAGVAEARRRLGDAGLRDLAARMRITPVLTAHPTEARRRAVVETLWRTGSLLDRFDDPGLFPDERADVERRLREEITALWRTDPLRRSRPEPLDEVRATMALFDQTIFRLLPALCRDLDRSLASDAGTRAPAFDQPPYRWGSWVGGDRDGNPHVTAEVTRRTSRIASEHVLLGLERATRRIARTLSASENGTPPSKKLMALLHEAASLLPSAAKELDRKLPDAPHRRALALCAHRLAATRTGTSGRYDRPSSYVADLRIISSSLAAAGAARLAYGAIQGLIWQTQAFGFHLVELEVRQHSDVHREALAEIRSGAEPSARTREPLEAFRAIGEIQGRLGPDACRRYVVSFTHEGRDVLDVYELARAALPESPPELDVIPLFESRDDLLGATAILDDLLADETFRRELESRDRRMEVMLGYSDSAKEIGVLAANIALHRAQLELARWARMNRIELTIFHGRGGALGRGGGPTNRAILGQAAGSVDGRMKLTEQGEVAFSRYGNMRIAQRHMEQLTNAVLVASTPQHDSEAEAAWERHRDSIELMADASSAAYQGLVNHQAFMRSFLASTPMEEVGSMQLGSRPARRKRGAADLDSIRAIPWVFAWSQSRVNLPGWYGFGKGLEAVARTGTGKKELRAMARNWPFFASILENAELSLAKADMPIAERYLALGADPEIAEMIRTEFVLATRMVLEVTGHTVPLEGRPILRRAIDLRNPYVDALSFIQVRFLEDLRQGRGDPAQAMRLVHVTINGVAAGLQNTG